MTTVFDLIVSGIGQVVGWELITGLLFVLAFLLLAISRGLGITALLSTLLLSIYLFSENLINGKYLIGPEVLIIVVILFGLFIGWLLYTFFIE